MIKHFIIHTNSSIIYEELTYLEKELYINFCLSQNSEAVALSMGRAISQFLRNFYNRCKPSPRVGSKAERMAGLNATVIG
jgi:hypothetical protein